MPKFIFNMQRNQIKALFLYRRVIWEMAVTQLKTKYAQSFLGIAWAVINPFLIMLAVTFVFVYVFKVEIKNFPLFVLAGIYPWFFFSNAVSEAASSVINQKTILRQFNLPIEIIPLASVLGNFLNFLIGWIFIYPLFLLFKPEIFALLPFLLAGLFLTLIFVSGIGLLISILNVFYRDIGQLLPVVLMFWLWVTPVFYSEEMVPANFRWICNVNPLTQFITFYRGVIFECRIPFLELINITGMAFLSLLVGWYVFVSFKPNILKNI